MGCAAPAEVSLEEFTRKLRNGRRLPLEGTLETTFRCNLRCAHCYVNELAGDAAEAARELPLPRLLQLIDEVADSGCLFLLLTGGEILVRQDFPELYRHALRRGLLVIVYTNGTLISDRIADLFAEMKPHFVEISLYGMTRETYEKVTQVKGSFDKCLAGIARLRERGVAFKLKTMALTWNYHEIPEMLAFARELGVSFRYDSFLNPRVDCGANRNGELQLSADQALQLDLFDPARVAELRGYMERHARPVAEPIAHTGLYSCGAGETGFTVDPYGNLQLCQLSRRSSADVRDASFAQGWQEDLLRLRSRTWRSNSVCRTCNLIALCASCPGAAEMETGDAERIVPRFCEITHARAFALMGEECGHRKDASCCLGGDGGRAAAALSGAAAAGGPPAGAAPPLAALAIAGGGCGSCAQASASPGPLLQIQRRAQPRRA